jgi:hypothetical protein
MEMRFLREVASGLLLVALLCALPVVAAASPSAGEENAPLAWWRVLQHSVAEWFAVSPALPPPAVAPPGVAPAQGVRSELPLRTWGPPVAQPVEPSDTPLLRLIGKDGTNTQCTGEGGPGWDPDGCH